MLPARRLGLVSRVGVGGVKGHLLFFLSCHMSDEWGDSGGDFKKQGFTLRSVPELGAGAKPPWKAEAGPLAASTGTCMLTECTRECMVLTRLV